jgi:phage-related protein
MEKFREITFYKTEAGRFPVIDFMDSTARRDEKAKIIRVLEIVERMQLVPVNFLKKLQGRENLWEIRVQRFRFLGFYADSRRMVLAHGFIKQSQKTPLQEIDVAIRRKVVYFSRV